MEANYLKLLKYEKELQAKGKSLSKQNEQDYKKLIKYEVSLLDHFKWEQKDRYFLLITNFLDKKIDTDQYICQLFKLEYEIQNLVEELKLDFEKLKEFEPNSVSKGFSKLIEELSSDCRIFEPDPDLRDDFEISETQLINGVRKIFLQIQEYSLNEENTSTPNEVPPANQPGITTSQEIVKGLSASVAVSVCALTLLLVLLWLAWGVV